MLTEKKILIMRLINLCSLVVTSEKIIDISNNLESPVTQQYIFKSF